MLPTAAGNVLDAEVQPILGLGVVLELKRARRPGPADRGKMRLDESGFPQPTGVLEELEADALILALGQLDYCKGCGLCAAECPAGAIQMEPEQI